MAALLSSRLPSRLSPLRLLEALVTPHAVDRYLELLHPMLTAREVRARVTAVRRTTASSVTLTMRPTRQWRGFDAGQYVRVTVPVDGVLRTRCFSLSGSQYCADGSIEITVKAHPDGLVSRHLYDHARPGLVLGLASAEGSFVLPEARPSKIVVISGGSGITPMLSMLRSLCDEGYRGEVALLHYTGTTAEVPQLEAVLALASHDNVRVEVACTAEPAPLTGHFGAHHLDAVAPWHAEAETFVCGPDGLMDAVRAHFATLGRADRVHTERFTLPTAPLEDAVTGTISFTRSGAAAENTGATLLEQTEAAGLDPEYGCRMGICFTCTRRKSVGCTRDLRTGETDSEPDTEIQLCVSVPVGDVGLDI